MPTNNHTAPPSGSKGNVLSLDRLTGPVLVLAPHADDESLGCGGLIASLRARDVPVTVWLVSDGTMSHPNSRDYPADRRQAIRETEFGRACHLLGVKPDRRRFFRFPDTQVPLPGTGGFPTAARQFAEALEELRPQTILTPWRRDPHCDHRATTSLIRTAIFQTDWKGTLYEYPVWLYELAAQGDAPHPDEVTVYRFKLSPDVLEIKRKAIQTHASQLGRVIHDDPEGFVLQPQVLAHFLVPTEYYYHTHEN